MSIPNPAPVLSVVIVAYKSREEISACLASIPAELDGGGVEVILVDNSLGADGTGELVRKKFPQVSHVLPEKNLGFGRANNLGFKQSSGECVLFLNPDTICEKQALEHCLRRVRSEPTIGMISPKLVLADGSMDLASRRSIPTLWDGFCRATGLAAGFPKTKLFTGYNLTYLPEDGTYEVGAINGAFMMARREIFKTVGLFDEGFFMYGDDLDLCIRVARAGFRIVYDGRIKITHLKGLSVAKDYGSMSQAIFDANRDVYLKHFNPGNSRMVRWKYQFAFWLWKKVALLRARLRGHGKVRPV